MPISSYILMGIITVSVMLAVYYSITSRTQSDFLVFRFRQAKMNICIGIALFAMSITQFTYPDFSYVRLAVALVFLALGFVNFTMGIKNYKRLKKERENA
ncbi:hypothetical protein BSNK01_24890 [Bacillaceae bacterium]